MTIHILRANNGDCIHISFDDEQGNERNVLVDSGKKQTYLFYDDNKKKQSGDLKFTIDKLRERGKIFDLVVLTHIDEDHIGGFISWIENDSKASDMIGEVWFNSGNVIKTWLASELEWNNDITLNINPSPQTSVGQGVQFEKFLNDNNLWKGEIIMAGSKKNFHGLDFTILSPDRQRLENLLGIWEKERPDSLTAKLSDHEISLADLHLKNKLVTDQTFNEDNAVPNGSSIAFLLSFKDKDFLFLADAFPSVIVKSLEDLGYSDKDKISVEFVKISHHGSNSNTSPKLFRIINSKNYVVSTNSKQDNHPHKQLLGRLIDHHPDCVIYFNYGELVARIFNKQDYIDYPDFIALPLTEPFIYE